MKKRFLGRLLLLPAIFGMSLSSCSSDDPSAIVRTEEAVSYNVTITATLPESGITRASFEPSGSIIKFEWELNDAVYVVNSATGKYIGRLSVSAINENDKKKCSFAGTITPDVNTENLSLRFYYMGKKGVFNAPKPDRIAQNLIVDFSAQNGSSAAFADYDILDSGSEALVFSKSKVQTGDLGIIDFGRHFAYAQYILKYNGEALNIANVPVNISANTGTLYNKVEINFKEGTYTPQEGNIVVTPTSNNFYMTLIPSECNRKFECEVGGVKFVGTSGVRTEANKYYNDNGGPIVVEMQEAGYRVIFDILDATGTKPDDIKQETNPVTLPTGNLTFEKEGYEFKGWSDKKDDTPENAKSQWTFTGDYGTVTLYPVWEKLPDAAIWSPGYGHGTWN